MNTSRLALTVAATTAAMLVLALPAGAQTAARSGGGAILYADAAGDSNGAPDISGVEISSTDAGLATFRVDVPIVAADTSSLIGVAIDADNNTATGDPAWGGADYEIDSYQDDHSYTIERWNSTTSAWDAYPDAATVDVAWDASGIDFSINRSELGNAGTVGVFAYSYVSFAEPQQAQSDFAPDDGADSFDLAPLTLSTALFHATAAKAGSELGLVLVARRSDSGGYVTEDAGAKVSCGATGAGRPLGTIYSGFVTAKQIPVGTCMWKLGRTLQSRLVRATITVTLNGHAVARTVSVKVR